MATTGNKHASRSAQTRRRFIKAAQKLYAERSIDSVSLNEITVAAGQKNRNALQYHFGNKEGLIQAILDLHADRVAQLRQDFAEKGDLSTLPPAEAAARLLVTPVGEYIRENPAGVHYVKILSQLAALNSTATNPGAQSGLSFRQVPQLETFITEATSHLGEAEQRRRLFLAVSITFHSIADICRAFDGADSSGARQRKLMLDQVIATICAMLSAPARG
jgi:AcrR family transcriptional regulator